MYENKKVLLIAGGGTLGGYTAEELIRLGCRVDVICPEDKVSLNARLRYFQAYATDDYLKDLFEKEGRYDGIVSFLHYANVQDYYKTYPLLSANTDHLIFLSSYRVYANEQHPLTETAPRLYDVSTDEEFLKRENYAVPKSKCEDFLRGEHPKDRWTIVRPVISFSRLRLDLLLYNKHEVLDYARRGEELLLPNTVKDYQAGLDWAGNSGKLIANLLFKEAAIGETFTVYSGHGMTWGDVAQMYHQLTGVKVRWCDEAEYVQHSPVARSNAYIWIYDRKFNRDVDCSKIMKATGLTPADFVSPTEGLRRELAYVLR